MVKFCWTIPLNLYPICSVHNLVAEKVPGWGCYLEKRFCKQFLESSTVVLHARVLLPRKVRAQKIVYKTSSPSKCPS